MPFLDLAGTPAVRFPDPKIKRIRPDGSQPYTAYYAPLVYLQNGSYDFILSNPPDVLVTELLLFGSDYPAKIAGTQVFPGNAGLDGAIYDTAGNPIPFTNLSLPLFPPPFGSFETGAVLDILPSVSGVEYKQIATGATATNGVTVSGYPVLSLVPSRNLWEGESGSAGPRADYLLAYDITLNGSVVDGPVAYIDNFGASTDMRMPVILWEPDLTQEIVDNGYLIEGTNLGTLDVVGLWAGGGYSPLVGPTLGARSFGAPAPASSPYLSPAIAEAAAAYAERVKGKK